MRLWHYELLPYLPKSQLLSQKRECDLIIKTMWNKGEKVNHILINYIYEYSDISFTMYYALLYQEFMKRKFKFNDTFRQVNTLLLDNKFAPFTRHHNNTYLLVCFMNLYEKYKAKQKDFDTETFNRLYDFVNTKFDLTQLGITRGKIKNERY